MSSPAIVFLGPSMPVAEAQRLLEGEYRRPVRRGDLVDIEPQSVVAIIDGVFEQSLAVSPREVQEAVDRGVTVFGGASMGALRAAEVTGVIGVGQIFAWYRDGIVVRDDEVALLFDDDTGVPLTVPVVNVRFAVEQLRRPGTIAKSTADRLIAAALDLPFKDRTYKAIVERAGLAQQTDADDLVALLQSHDLKRLDAQAVLEAIDRYQRDRGPSRAGTNGRCTARPVKASPHGATARSQKEILIWESGDRATVGEVLQFLVFTGSLEARARSCLARSAVAGQLANPMPTVAAEEAQAVLNNAARRWGWMSPEEARVTLADLGVELSALDQTCVQEVLARKAVFGRLRTGDGELEETLRAQLFLDDLALKRETMRLGALRFFADRGPETVPRDEIQQAQTVLCKINREFDFGEVRDRWTLLGQPSRGKQDAFVLLLARARRSARKLAAVMRGIGATSPLEAVADGTLGLLPSPKPPGERRFSLPLAEAFEHSRRLGEVIGVRRVGMIGELAPLGGIQIAQAARPAGTWSSSYGSGKSRTKDGAVVGSIMEETEKWAQEQFRPAAEALVRGTYAELSHEGAFVSPATLDLPYDSVYEPELPLHWFPCVDILSGQRVHVPVDVLQLERGKHDICYTARGGRKHIATNGLGSGFSREEALLHATCEYVERHALRLAEILLANPGGLGGHPYRFVDLATASDLVEDLARRLEMEGGVVRVLDITSDVAIPTFMATITRDLQRADGYAAHPDPDIAMEMALLEAAQTIASAVAGGREDLSIKARSLGRHERPRPVSVDDAWFWLDPDVVYTSATDIAGFRSGDICEELRWALARLRGAGIEQVPVLDLTLPKLAPAHVVRVIIPGLETNNPFFTGARARLVLLRDLLPRWR